MRVIKEDQLLESTYKKAIDGIIKDINKSNPEYECVYNKDHRCVDVFDNGVLKYQVYPSREDNPHEINKKTLRRKPFDQLTPDDDIWVREPITKTECGWTKNNRLVNEVSKVGADIK